MGRLRYMTETNQGRGHLGRRRQTSLRGREGKNPMSHRKVKKGKGLWGGYVLKGPTVVDGTDKKKEGGGGDQFLNIKSYRKGNGMTNWGL